MRRQKKFMKAILTRQLWLVTLSIGVLAASFPEVANSQETLGKKEEKVRKQFEAEKKQLATLLRGRVVDSLKDPKSAQMRREFLSDAETSDLKVTSLCGEINAKNSYGGYTGFTRFISNTDGMLVYEASEPPGAFSSIWPVWCGRPI